MRNVKHPNELTELSRLLRMGICRKCPHAQPRRARSNLDAPRDCEAGCPIFERLPTLLAYAQNLDPLVGSFDKVVEALAGQCTHSRRDEDDSETQPHVHRRPCPLKMFEEDIAEILREESRRLRHEPSGDRPHQSDRKTPS